MSDVRLTIEFEVPEDEAELITKLIDCARKLGIKHYARDSFDAEAATESHA